MTTTDTAITLASIDEILEDARAGRMFILVDDENRENEGDLVIPADHVTPEAINFMAKFGRGLICLALTRDAIQQLGIPMMTQHNTSRHETAFTVSIEAREGVTTGISAADRTHTIRTAINPQFRPGDIATPGHIFPLAARDGGVLVRAGHTEAAVDIARMAGVQPAGVICEIMNDDGSMARLPDLMEFAKTHKLNVGTIADLISYRRRNERMVERILEAPFHSEYGGEWKMHVYASKIEYAEHIVLTKGDIQPDQPTWVRMHALDVLYDVLGDVHNGRESDLHPAMEKIAAHGNGVIVLLRPPYRNAVSERMLARLQVDSQPPSFDLRDYGIGAQILLDLGITNMTLLSNSQRQVVGLDGYGLRIAGYETIPHHGKNT
ncbi:MAG: 3,4-dihydroxy-2-butanone-4-phosphate synthase [Alphaproteobacteria bacterium]|nr:3,4-dihydroxy-2-butanone-4-phosphate synthase [Alphaproteobacteria bacterium]